MYLYSFLEQHLLLAFNSYLSDQLHCLMHKYFLGKKKGGGGGLDFPPDVALDPDTVQPECRRASSWLIKFKLILCALEILH